MDLSERLQNVAVLGAAGKMGSGISLLLARDLAMTKLAAENQGKVYRLALTDVNEAGMPTPWSVDDAPADYTDQLIGGIVGIELEVVRIEAKRKLSQNKSDADRDGAIAGLAGSPLPGSDAVRRAMDHPSRNAV